MNISNAETRKVSKFLSYVLRHCPDDIGMVLEEGGWVQLSVLIKKAKPKMTLTLEIIRHVVETNDKQRFKISDDGHKIRASQGHSVTVDLKLEVVQPPAFLFHGTTERFMQSIMAEGLKAKQRHHVHLSENEGTAKAVGSRHGKPVILTVASGEMVEVGFEFFCSDNQVWLTQEVPVKFLSRAT
ncbi:MAG: RNA 2'-phosphotransferase [Methylococcales bacterium]|nr:RNA 2'-phosphotransferase [Methylococcales bacterium]